MRFLISEVPLYADRPLRPECLLRVVRGSGAHPSLQNPDAYSGTWSNEKASP